MSDANNCITSNQILITATFNIAISSTITNETCLGSSNGSIDIGVSGGVLPYTFIWLDPSNQIIGNTEDVNNLTTGTYHVVVTDANGCSGLENITVSSINSTPWPYHPIDGTDKQRGTSVAVDNEGNVYAVGYFQDEVTFDIGYTTNGNKDIYMVKLDECGNIIWSKQIGGSGPDDVYKVLVDNSGDIIITGYFSNQVYFGNVLKTSVENSTDLFVAKYLNDGTFVWVYTYGTPNSDVMDVGNDIAIDASNNVYVVGTVGDGNYGDIYVLKLDEDCIYINDHTISSGNSKGLGVTYCNACSSNAKILITGQMSATSVFIGTLDEGLNNFTTYTYTDGLVATHCY